MRYTGLQRFLHWVIALLVLATLGAGLTLGVLEFEGTKATFGQENTNLIYKYHKTFGLIILGLMLVRLFVRLESGKPDLGYLIAGWEKVAAAIVQYLLYLCLIAQPILGWLATDASNFPVEFFIWNVPQFIAKDEVMGETLYHWHGMLGWTTAALLVLHIGGALRHWLILRDGVMGRMRPY